MKNILKICEEKLSQKKLRHLQATNLIFRQLARTRIL